MCKCNDLYRGEEGKKRIQGIKAKLEAAYNEKYVVYVTSEGLYLLLRDTETPHESYTLVTNDNL